MSVVAGSFVQNRPLRAEFGSDGVKITKEYQLQTDDPTDDEFVVRRHPDIPALGHQIKSFDNGTLSLTGVFLTSIEVERNEDVPTFWIVRLNYETVSGSGTTTPGDEEENPLAADPEISRSFSVSSEPQAIGIRLGQTFTERPLPLEVVTQLESLGQNPDYSPVENTAGEPFDPPPEREIYDAVIRITRNEREWDQLYDEFQGAINSTQLWGRAPGTCKLTITANSARQGRYTFERVTYEIHYRADGWFTFLLNKGYRYLDGGPGGTLTVATDDTADALPTNQPVLLQENGDILQAGAQSRFIVYVLDPFKYRDFNYLGLPQF